MNRFPFFILTFVLMITGCNSSGPLVDFDTEEQVYTYTEELAESFGEFIRATTYEEYGLNESRIEAANMAEKACDCLTKLDLEYAIQDERERDVVTAAQEAVDLQEIDPSQKKVMAYYTTLMLCADLVEYGRIDGNYDGELPTNGISMGHKRYYEQALDSICPEAKQQIVEYQLLDEERAKEQFERAIEGLKKMQQRQ